LESLSASTHRQNIRAQAWASPFASASSSGPAEEFGWNLSPEEVRHFSLRSLTDPQSDENSSESVRHILLVEDSAADIGLIREALEEYHVRCDLTVIVNGELAIQYFDEIDAGEHTCPDLVIIDLNLPKRSGKEVLRHLRTCESCPDVTVIVLTSSDNQTDRDDVTGFRLSRYIRKPSRLEEFLELGAVFKNSLYPAN
jgi:CheY-like chemotaxis protein